MREIELEGKCVVTIDLIKDRLAFIVLDSEFWVDPVVGKVSKKASICTYELSNCVCRNDEIAVLI